MSRKKKNSGLITREQMRFRLFLIWAGLLVFYVTLFLLRSAVIKDGVEFPEVADAAWKVTYLMVPVLGLFGGYWFKKKQEEARETNDNLYVSKTVWRAAYILTFVLHFIVFLYFVFGIYMVHFWGDINQKFFDESADIVVKILMLVWSTSLLPVVWIVEGEKPPLPELPPAETVPTGNSGI